MNKLFFGVSSSALAVALALGCAASSSDETEDTEAAATGGKSPATETRENRARLAYALVGVLMNKTIVISDTNERPSALFFRLPKPIQLFGIAWTHASCRIQRGTYRDGGTVAKGDVYRVGSLSAGTGWADPPKVLPFMMDVLDAEFAVESCELSTRALQKTATGEDHNAIIK
jgi:hypothetical protein